MIDPRDLQGLRLVRSELARRGIDMGRADLRVMHGVLYIRGNIGATPGVTIPDIRHEMEHLTHILRQRAQLKEVILDCAYLS